MATAATTLSHNNKNWEEYSYEIGFVCHVHSFVACTEWTAVYISPLNFSIDKYSLKKKRGKS